MVDLDRASIRKLSACLSYGTVSVSMTLFNKAVFSVYQFNFPNFVTTLQIIISIIYMLILENLRILEIEPISMRTATMVMLHLGLLLVFLMVLRWPHLSNLCGALCPGVSSDFFLVAVCGVWGHCTAIPHGAHVQVRHDWVTARAKK